MQISKASCEGNSFSLLASIGKSPRFAMNSNWVFLERRGSIEPHGRWMHLFLFVSPFEPLEYTGIRPDPTWAVELLPDSYQKHFAHRLAWFYHTNDQWVGGITKIWISLQRVLTPKHLRPSAAQICTLQIQEQSHEWLYIARRLQRALKGKYPIR